MEQNEGKRPRIHPVRLTACDRHLQGAAAVEAACFAQPWSANSLELLTKDGIGVGFACMDGDRVVAYGGMTTVLDEGSVANVATHPDYRRRGLGRQIVSALLAEAAPRGLERIYLEVRVSNEAAWRLYEEMGFLRVGTRKNFYRHPVEDGWAMEWSRSGR